MYLNPVYPQGIHHSRYKSFLHAPLVQDFQMVKLKGTAVSYNNIVEITHDKRGVMQGFTTNSDISNTKAKPECF